MAGLDLIPADLGPLGGFDAAAERQRERLAAEADPEYRDAAFLRGPEQLKLRDQPAADPFVIVGRPGRAHRHDHVEGPRIGKADVDARVFEPVRRHDQELGHVWTPIAEPVPHRSGRGAVVVLDEQDAHRTSRASAGAGPHRSRLAPWMKLDRTYPGGPLSALAAGPLGALLRRRHRPDDDGVEVRSEAQTSGLQSPC